MSRYYLPFVLIFVLPWAVLADEPKPAAPELKPDREGHIALFDGKSLAGWKPTEFGGDGDVVVKDGQIVLKMGQPLTGITWQHAEKLPKDNFEITLQAMKRKGDDFFCGLTFPVRDSHASFICGGWGGTLVGLSSIDDLDASENETTDYVKFDHNKWYKIRVRVAEGKVGCWVDDKQMVDVELEGKKIGTRIEVDASKPLGIANFNVESSVKDIKLRHLDPKKAAGE